MELSITLVESEAALVSTLWQERDGDMSACKYINSVIGGHIARLGEFSSLACTAWQMGGVAPFFSLQAAVSQLWSVTLRLP